MTDTHKLLNTPTVQNVLDVLDSPQRRFVLQATIGQKSMSAAARDAGMKSVPKGVAVLTAIQIIRVELAKDLDISLDDCKRGMIEAVEMARSNGEAMPMIAGWKEVAKLCGYYDDGPKININIEHLDMRDLQSLSEEELRSLIAKAPEALEGVSTVVRTEPT